jgi:hypothetical protein
VTLTQECTPLLLARESDEIGIVEPFANGSCASSDLVGDLVLSRSEMVLGDGKKEISLLHAVPAFAFYDPCGPDEPPVRVPWVAEREKTQCDPKRRACRA